MILFLFIGPLSGMDWGTYGSCGMVVCARNKTPLITALQHGDCEQLKMLVKNGANVNECDEKGLSLAWETIDGRKRIGEKMMVELVELYIKNGLDVHHKVGFSQSNLVHKLAAAGITSLFNVIIAAGAEINAKNTSQDTPLLQVLWECSIIEKYWPLTVKKLILAGADVNAQNDEGKTPLHYAIKDKQIVALLLYHNADYEIKDKKGHKPYDKVKDPEIKKMLKDKESVNKAILSHVQQEKFRGLNPVYALRNREHGMRVISRPKSCALIEQ